MKNLPDRKNSDKRVAQLHSKVFFKDVIKKFYPRNDLKIEMEPLKILYRTLACPAHIPLIGDIQFRVPNIYISIQ